MCIRRRASYVLLAWGIAAVGGAALGMARPSEQGRHLPVGRGIAPADAALYLSGAGDTFTCRSGSPTFAYEKLNDNYCDCPDGSDEPGTSACSMFASATFFCPNRGDEGKFILSQFVDDGICDCCDGSDELGTVSCPDTCVEEGRSKMVELQSSLADAEAGLRKKDVLLKAASARRAEWEKRLEHLEEIESRTAQEKVKAEVRKKSAESRLERAEQVVDRLAEKLETMNSRSSVVETGTGDSSNAAGDGDAVGESDANAGADRGDVPFEDDTRQGASEEETEEERAKRVASQWIHDDKDNDEDDDEDEDDDDQDDETYEAPGFEGGDEEEDVAEDIVDGDTEDSPLGLLDTIKLWIGDQVARLTGTVDVGRELRLAKVKLGTMERLSKEASTAFKEKNRALRELEGEVADLRAKQRHTYGDGDAFLPLSESCVETALIDGKYTYKLCPFGSAKQMEGRRSTGLGTWEGFAETGGETVMRFVNGDACWQGPNRSMVVKLRCGPIDSFDAVSEPSRCAYTGVLTTPAFCSESIVEGLKKEVRRRQAVVDPSTADTVSHQEL